MSENKLIHAFTSPGADAPPYINVSRMEDGSVRVIVRGKPYPNHTSGTEEIVLSQADWRSLVGSVISEAGNVKEMVDSFLTWKVPADFAPDGGIKFEPTPMHGGGFSRPVGTNLLTATQAEAMVRHMLEGLPKG